MKDLADLAKDAYQDSGAPDGWSRLENYPGPEGFYAVAYRNDETGEIVLAYRGSQPPPDLDLGDWSDDVNNANNLPTAQGAWALKTAQELAEKYPGHVEFTGHSLGGSLASMASIATGYPATTYNAAGIGTGNYAAAVAAAALNHGGGVSEQQITNYHTPNDILTNGQKALHVTGAAGAQVTIASNTGNPGKAHGLGSFVWP
ncbi:Mbeg1-like protein [Nocardioides acrostichi]|uniref:Mbeg1-like protein n=1 Tax=Nocardioides acrostichi TaxID=2784339 RepID=UPI0038B2BC69